MSGVANKQFYLTDTAASPSPGWGDGNYQLSTSTGSTDITITLANLATKNYGWVWQSDFRNASWEDGGTSTLNLNITSTEALLRARVRVVSLNSSNVIQQSGTYTAYQTLAASRVFSVTSPTWTHSESSTNRLGYEIEVNNLSEHGGDESATFDCSTTGNSDLTAGIVYKSPSATPEFNQKDFRFRKDDGSESSATWRVAANVDDSVGPGVNFRVRFNISNQGNTVASSTGDAIAIKAQYSKNSGAWTDVTSSSSNIKVVNSTNLTDGADTTQQLGSGTFISDNDGVNDTNSAITIPSGATWNNLYEAELETCFQLVTADVANNDTIDLRYTMSSGTDPITFETYTKVPGITVLKVTPVWTQTDFRIRNDDGSETTATWRQLKNVNDSVNVDSDVIKRVRFVVRSDVVFESPVGFQVEYSKNGGTWATFSYTAGVAFYMANSTNLAYGEDTTQQIGSGTYVTDNNAILDDAFLFINSVAPANRKWAINDEFELELAGLLSSSNLANNDTLDIRVKSLDTYTNTARITVTKSAGGTRRIFITSMN